MMLAFIECGCAIDFLPKRTNKPPSLPNKSNEHTNTCSFLAVAIYSIGHQDSRNDLVSNSCNSRTNNRCNIPVKGWSLLNADQEDHNSTDSEQITRIAEPQSEFRLGTLLDLALAAIHPEVRQRTAKLGTDEGAHDHADELETKLLGVEVELFAEELRGLDRDQNATEEEYHRVCGRWNKYTSTGSEYKRLDVVPPCQWRGIDAFEIEVFLFEARAGVLYAPA